MSKNPDHSNCYSMGTGARDEKLCSFEIPADLMGLPEYHGTVKRGCCPGPYYKLPGAGVCLVCKYHSRLVENRLMEIIEAL